MKTKTIFLGIGLFFTTAIFSLAQNIKFDIRPDGTFDVKATNVSLLNCYPAINNSSLKPTKINFTNNASSKTIQYTLIDGTLELSFSYEGNALKITPNLKSKTIVADYISILRDAEVKGANKIYRTSKEHMGEGGVKKWPKDKTEFSNCSGVTGLVPDSGSTLVIATRDFRKYMSYTNLSPTDRNEGKKMIEVYLAAEGIPVTTLPSFYLTENTSAFLAMQNEAKAVATVMNVKTDKPQSYHWCSWYYAYFYLTDQMLSGYLKGFNTIKPRIPIKTVQIDAGYHPHVGDWLEPSDKFPNGLEASVKEILADGYKAGIWIGPYMVGNRSKLYKEHPNWILRTKDGKPIINLLLYGENRLWGAMDEEIYALDTSNPEVMNYLRNVFRTFRKLGITLFKTDFMLYGAENSNKVIRHTPGKTSMEYQREFFEMIRQEIGPESFWLGCIASFEPLLGFADAMRISGDIAPNWESSITMFTESKGMQHVNNVWFQNDPDAIILRSKYNHMSDMEAKSLILWMGMLGGVINTSDIFHEIPKERTALFRFLEPNETKLTAAIPFIDKDDKFEVLVRNYPNKNAYAVLFINRKEEEISKTYSLQSLIGSEKGICFDWDENGNQNLGEKTSLNITLKPHESKLIYISKDGKSPQVMTLGGKE